MDERKMNAILAARQLLKASKPKRKLTPEEQAAFEAALKEFGRMLFPDGTKADAPKKPKEGKPPPGYESWEEFDAKHPRGPGGKFGSGSAASAEPAEEGFENTSTEDKPTIKVKNVPISELIERVMSAAEVKHKNLSCVIEGNNVVCTGKPNMFTEMKAVYSISGSDKSSAVRFNIYSKLDGVTSSVLQPGFQDSWERRNLASAGVPQDKLEAFMLDAVSKK